MPNYINYQSILEAALCSYKDYGFSIEETTDSGAILYHNNIPLASFSKEDTTMIRIHSACLEYLKNISIGQ